MSTLTLIKLMIHRFIPILTFCISPYPIYAQLPETDIFLCKVNVTHHSVSLSKPLNITAQKGYQNQPCFSKDGGMIYYTSQCDTCSKTSIYTYSIHSKQKQEMIATRMSPYSAMPAPVAKAITAVTVEADSLQRIWQYNLDDNNAVALFKFRDSVGYYDWINEHAVLAYILGTEPLNSRLSLLTDDGNEKQLAINIGRGIRHLGNGAFYIQHKDSINFLAWTDLNSTSVLVKTPGNSEDLAIFDNYVLMADKSVLYYAAMNVEDGKLKSVEEFRQLQDLAAFGLKQISRIAISPDNKFIALVASGE